MTEYSTAYYEHRKPIPIPINREQIYNAGQYYHGVYRILFYLLYLTGGRISEVLSLRRDDITLQKSNNVDVLLINLYTEKNRGIDFRYIPITCDENYNHMITPVMDYVATFDFGQKLFKMSRQVAYNHLSKQTILIRATKNKQIIENYSFKIRPHYLRHCRLTHLVTLHNFNEFSLMQFAGWTNIKPATFYVRQNWQDLVSRMTRD